jgi:4-hydroxythreonine-4-phosphate dehydrogenase
MNAPSTRTALCLTIGDPKGIGPEITVKALQSTFPSALYVIGEQASLQQAADMLGLSLPPESFLLQYVDIVQPSPGQVAYKAIETAVTLIAEQKAIGLVTGPISKENLWKAGIPYSGHTEILEAFSQKFSKQFETHPLKLPHLTNSFKADMLFRYEKFRMLLLTRHIPLSLVSQELSVPDVVETLSNLVLFLQHVENIPKPNLAILGLNPHAGEIGGEEEGAILQPAINAINKCFNLDIAAPLPADAVFRGFDSNVPSYDCYVAAYHDQGLIPMKLVGGLNAVNITIGLPFLRTSVSHGTAPDIVGQGMANPTSLISAIETLEDLLHNASETVLNTYLI